MVSDPPRPVRNAITGGVAGPSVQAGAIHGNVHFHQGAAGGIPAVPRQLRPPPAHFTGRDRELTELDQIAGVRERDGPALLVISGPGGVGKSALALRWLHGVVDHYPDGQLYVDLGIAGTEQPLISVLGGFLRALGITPERVPVEVGEAASLFRSVTAGKRIAVLVDNAGSAAQVRTLLPASPSSVVVVATRWRLGGLALDGAGFLPLAPLPASVGADLLERTIGGSRVSHEPDATARLVELCGGLPLALAIIGARLAMRPDRPLAGVANELTDEQHRLSALSVEQDVSVRGAFDLSYAGLAPPAARAYRWCGMHPGPYFRAGVAAAVLEQPVLVAAELLETLVNASLLEVRGADRYHFHDLVRLHARQCAELEDPEDVRTAALRRITEHYLTLAVDVDRAVTPWRLPLGPVYQRRASVPSGYASGMDALDRLEPELPNLMAVLRAGMTRRFDDLVWQLCEAMWSLFLYRKHFPDWITAHLLGIEAAVRCGNQAAEAHMHLQLGFAFNNLGRSDEAHDQGTAALAAARITEDRRSESEALNLIGMADRNRGRYDEAIRALRIAVGLDRDGGWTRYEAIGRRRLGQALTAAGRIEDAISELRRARDQAAALRDARVEANTIVSLADALSRAGSSAEAIELLPGAWSTLTELGSKQDRALVLMVWGEAAERLGDLETARDRLTQAHNLYAELGLPHVTRVRELLDSVESRLGPR